MIKTQSEIWDATLDADLIVFHPGMPIGYFIAQVSNKKSVLLNPFPVVATKDYPSILFYTLPRIGNAFNNLTHAILFALQPKVVNAANQLGVSMRKENGNKKAVEIILKHLITI